jgi:hypothetical protein
MSTIKRKGDKQKIELKNIRMPDFGVFLFSIVFIYILIRIIGYMNDSQPTIFTVEQSSYDTDFTATGIAVRDETIVTAGSTGTACYYVRDGEKVAKDANVYSLDQSGSMQSAMDDLQSNSDTLITSEDYSDISSRIKMFKTGYSESNFSDVYSFKTSINTTLIELYEQQALSQLGVSEDTLAKNAVKAPFSGIVAYYQDGYENVTVDDLTPELFDKTLYSKSSMKKEGDITAGEPVYKLIDDNEWTIAIALSEDEYEKVTRYNYATFTINDSGRKIQTLYDKIEKDGNYYITVTFNKYMAQYVSERFLDINFIFSESTGLKIPKSAVVTKDVYMIPKEYLANEEEDVDPYRFAKLDDSGNAVKFAPLIYFTDDKYCYVDPDDIDADAILKKSDEDDGGISVAKSANFYVATAAKYTLKGVLCVSNGLTEFKRISVIVEGDDYLIVQPNITYGISRYDRILLDGESMKEGEIIY